MKVSARDGATKLYDAHRTLKAIDLFFLNYFIIHVALNVSHVVQFGDFNANMQRHKT